MIKIEFPADRPDIARAMATALTLIANPELQKEVSDAVASTEALERASGGTDAERHKEFVTGLDAAAEAATLTGSTDQDTPDGDPIDDTTSVFGGAAPADPNIPVDLNGVPFHVDYCSKAAKPFYASGKRSGQWKKRQGVEETAYEGWYAAQLDAAPATASTSAPANDEPISTASAFGNTTPTTPLAPPVPTDAGSFIGWTSAKQAAGLLTPEDIGAAYTQAGVDVMALFNDDEAAIAKRIAVVYDILVVKAGA